jgi:hypothetical protein
VKTDEVDPLTRATEASLSSALCDSLALGLLSSYAQNHLHVANIRHMHGAGRQRFHHSSVDVLQTSALAVILDLNGLFEQNRQKLMTAGAAGLMMLAAAASDKNLHASAHPQ